MKKSKFSNSQIVAILKEGDAGLPVDEVRRIRWVDTRRRGMRGGRH